MKKLTPKQRAKIYLKAAKFFEKQLRWFNKHPNKENTQNYFELPRELKQYGGEFASGFCDFLCVYDCSDNFINNFPEYLLFQEDKIYWFDRQEDRVNALLLSYHMALDAKE